jgi:hypothetical protein
MENEEPILTCKPKDKRNPVFQNSTKLTLAPMQA